MEYVKIKAVEDFSDVSKILVEQLDEEVYDKLEDVRKHLSESRKNFLNVDKLIKGYNPSKGHNKKNLKNAIKRYLNSLLTHLNDSKEETNTLKKQLIVSNLVASNIALSAEYDDIDLKWFPESNRDLIKKRGKKLYIICTFKYKNKEFNVMYDRLTKQVSVCFVLSPGFYDTQYEFEMKEKDIEDNKEFIIKLIYKLISNKKIKPVYSKTKKKKVVKNE